MSLGHQSIFLGSSGGGGFSFVEVTHAEILELISTASLVVGGYYLITDFQTIYDQPDYWLEGSPKEPHELVTKTSAVTEPLLCIAVSNNDITSEVYSTIYPKDVLQYDVRFIETEVKNTPAKGRIFYRKDDKNNITGYDHRHVVFKRYLNLAVGNYIEYKDNGQEFEEYLTFIDPSSSNNNILNSSNSTYFSDFLLTNNVFEYALDQSILSEFRNNYINDGEYNVISGDFVGNIIKGSFINNNIRNSFKRNKLNGFYRNITNSSFNNNTSNGYAGLIFDNIIHKNVSSCLFSNFSYNLVNVDLVEEDFTASVHVASNYTKTIYSDAALGKRLNYFNNNNLLFANITD